MDGIILQNIDNEKDLKVTFQNNLKCNRHCTKTVNAANRILGMTKRSLSFSYLEKIAFCICIRAWLDHI